MNAPITFPQGVELVRRLRTEVAKVFVGQEAIVEQALSALLIGGHVLLEGVPGLGKTLLVKALAKTVGGRFARIQFTPDLMPADITGHAMFDAASSQFVIRRGPLFANLVLADEINRAPAKTQAALLEVMQERQVTIEGTLHELASPFLVLATQNPIEQEGTYALPEAQLDRFLLKVYIDYPSIEHERQLVRHVTEGRVGDRLEVDAVAQVLAPEQVAALQQLTASLRVDETVTDYAVRLARATRSWPGIAIGAGPRGGIALVRAARGVALLAGREFVTPDDIKVIAKPALRHRVLLAPEAEIEGLTVDTLLGNLLAQVDAPRA
ncbi:MAG: MoxR family ATPase [Gammaproteobacteria bacterium]|nr:MoxR family ATPase [Gammaproteobacteria bacterium]